MAHQDKLYEQAIGNNIEVRITPTSEQIKDKVWNFLKNGNTDDVTEWILETIDFIGSMNHAMSEWDDTRYKDEYDNLVKWGLIDED